MENNHKTWLDNEYSQWVKALQESTVHNFKEHPVVKRMLGEVDADFWKQKAIGGFTINGLDVIDSIGRKEFYISGICWRYIYYAKEILKRNPTSICEIGGGVGQFYAILRALGYKGSYFIFDLPEVREFQKLYLSEVAKITGLNTSLSKGEFDQVNKFCCSFYTLGEFDDENKYAYFSNVVNFCMSGYIAWNPHSGASDDLSLFRHDIKVTPGIEEGIKIVTW